MSMNLLFMSGLFIIAGAVHLISPEVFLPAIPPFIPYALELILLTGIFEIVLVLGLWTKKFRDLSAKTIALYLLLLVPVHVYVSASGIGIMGVNDPLLLWGRTLFQFVLIFLALMLQTKSWMIEQVWRHVVFLHYKIDPELIQDQVPFKLDLHEGKAVLSIVPFFMTGIRFPFLPAVPVLSSLWELNIRTYVEVNGVKGVFFFTLETDSKPGELIARHLFHLPYRKSEIRAKVSAERYEFYHQRGNLSFSLSALIGSKTVNDAFTVWATERYRLFTQSRSGDQFMGIVSHAPWSTQELELLKTEDEFTKMVTSSELTYVGSSYAKELKVRFIPFIKLTP